MTADLQKNVNFGHFTVLHISHPNEQIFTFQVSCGHLVVIFIILKGFSESRKNWRFSWPRTCEKLSFLGISHFPIFLTQMSKYLHFKCPVVNWWRFSSFGKPFQKVEKIEVFHDRGPAKKCQFLAFHSFAYFSSKWANIHISSVLWSSGGDFHHFKRLSRKSKKLKIFMTADLRKIVIFGHFTFFAYFSPKWANIYISSVLWSTGGDFQHFKSLSRKSKNLKIFMTANLEMPKNDNLSQVRGHENLQFFRLFKKPFKMMKTTISWPQDTWNVNICSFGWKICKFVKCPKMTFFSQVRGHEKFQFFGLSKKSFKLMKITTSWLQDTWNVKICSFGCKICKFVKCPKMTICRRSAVMKIFNFFDSSKSLLKWWKPPSVDHRTLEM